MNLETFVQRGQRAQAAAQSQIINPKSSIAPALTRDELTQLTECEEVIKRGLHTFIEVGLALEVVRAKKLYREKFGTFEEYCRIRWDMTARRARQICSASEVVINLIGEKIDTNSMNSHQLKSGTIVPTTESQARPLAPLPPAAQRKVWAAAVAAAPEGKVTAAIVQEQVDAREKKLRKRRNARKLGSGKILGDFHPTRDCYHQVHRLSQYNHCLDCGTLIAPENCPSKWNQGDRFDFSMHPPKFLSACPHKFMDSKGCVKCGWVPSEAELKISPRGPVEEKNNANLQKKIGKSSTPASVGEISPKISAVGQDKPPVAATPDKPKTPDPQEDRYGIRLWQSGKTWHATITSHGMLIREGAYKSKYQASFDIGREIEKLIRL